MSFSGRVLCHQRVRGPGFAPQYCKRERILLLWYHGQVAQDFMCHISCGDKSHNRKLIGIKNDLRECFTLDLW